MSHVDDGTLHGYLDGQLTSMEVVKLEAHLAECEACRARLAEERELAQRALGILSHAAPPDAAIPPLRHVTSAPLRRWPAWMPAAWAASLLLALGGGWMIGGSSADRGSAERRLNDSASQRDLYYGLTATQSPTPAPAAADEPKVEIAAKTTAEADRQQTQAAAPAPGALQPPTSRAAEPTGAREENRAAAGRTDSLSRVGVVGAEAARSAPAAPSADSVVRPPVPIAQGAVAPAWGSVSVDSARALLGADPLAVAGLTVTRIRAGAEERTVLVEQRVDTAVVIRLYEQRATEQEGAARDAAAPTPSRERQARSTAQARYVGGLRVEILGALPADSLSRLLERLEPIRN